MEFWKDATTTLLQGTLIFRKRIPAHRHVPCFDHPSPWSNQPYEACPLCDLVRLERAKLDPVLVNIETHVSVTPTVSSTTAAELWPRHAFGRCGRRRKLTTYAVTIDRGRRETDHGTRQICEPVGYNNWLIQRIFSL